MYTLKDIIGLLTDDEMTQLFITLSTEVSKAQLLENYCGIHHTDGVSLYATIASMLHPVLDEFVTDLNITESKDISMMCIDVLMDAELLFIVGHDMCIKENFPDSPDAIFSAVCYEEDNPSDEPIHPKLSSVILLAENSTTVNDYTRAQIIHHELVHFMMEYLQRNMGFNDIISQVKKDEALVELLCDMLPFYYLGDRTLQSMLDKYLDYESKHIRSNLISNRLDMIKEIQSMV